MAGDDQEIPSGGGPLVYVADLDRPRLDPDDDHHLRRVRRVRPGDAVVLGDGAGGWRRGSLGATDVAVDGPIRQVARPTPAIGVAFALLKGSKPELAVQKLTELGVDRIGAFTAARSVVRWDESKADAALHRWQRVAREAAMQSRQPWLPEIVPVTTFAGVAQLPGAALAERGGEPPSLAQPLLLVGPEGGWDEDERAAGCPTVSLGPGVLRAETAAIVAGSLLAALRAGVVGSAEP